MKKLVCFILFIPLFGSCIWITEDAFIFDRETFERERQLWLEQDFQDYSFHFVFFPVSGPREGTFIIQDGIMRYIRKDWIGYDVEPGPLLSATDEHNDHEYYGKWGYSISNIYALMGKFGTSEPEGRTEITVKYDSVYHYPAYVVVNYTPPVQLLPPNPGEGYGYTISITDFNLDPPELRAEGGFFFDRETFDKERQLWLEQDFQNYSFPFTYYRDFFYKVKWKGTVVIKDGAFHSYNFSHPFVLPGVSTASEDEVLAWMVSISGIYARIAEEAGKETDENIWVDLGYHYKYHYPIYLYYFRTSPHNDPTRDVCYSLSIGDINLNPPELAEGD